MSDDRFAPLPLAVSREYPAYQFYARLGFTGHPADACLRYAALTVQNWLCDRIKQANGEVPEDICCPPQTSFMDAGPDALHSVKLSYCEIIALPEAGIWALTVREPDPSIAARAFVTHVGLRTADADAVEFGVRIDVVDRDAALPEQGKAFRPQFIRLLFETEGLSLSQASPLPFRRSTDIENRRDVAMLKRLADDRANRLPLVVFTHAERERIRITPEAFDRMMGDLMKAPLSPAPGARPGIAPPVPESPGYELPYDVTEFSKHIYGHAQAFVVSPRAFGELCARFNRQSLKPGDILVVEPRIFGGNARVLAYRPGMDTAWYARVTGELREALQCCTRHKPFDFGGVLFTEGARQQQRGMELAELRASIHHDKGSEQQLLLDQLERERALSAELAEEKDRLRAQMIEEYRRGEAFGLQSAEALEAALNDARAEIDRLKSSNASMQRSFSEFDAMRSAVERVQRIQAMPRTNRDVVEYFRLIFADRLGFTERGMRTAADCDINPAMLWECLYHTATALVDLYRDSVRDVEDRFKAATGWEMAPSEGSQTRKIAGFMEQRRDVYEGREISVEPHVKFPRSSRRTGAAYQRLYYAYDPPTGRVVVGYVGDHLENFSSLSFH
ncbi:MAG: hypothetical protein IJJ45_10175 [Clostridia bacterium]|nr:hypothetical protein [Clostridia bacterium]